MKCLTVVGARPQFIKAAALSVQLRSAGIEEVMVHTGQHYDASMSKIFFSDLGLPRENYNLKISGGTHGEMTGKMLAGIERVLLEEKPDLVCVYGDTNSTLAGALAAAKLHCPVAHVEAGLRSFNRLMPEEVNRVLVDHLSAHCFCPSDVAAKNLALEGIRSGVEVVGDVMFDVNRLIIGQLGEFRGTLKRLRVKPAGYYVATCHRAENTDDPERLQRILAGLSALRLPVVFPLHPRTRNVMTQSGLQPGPNVHLVEPLGYPEIMELVRDAAAVLTDSGGLQKEAYWLRVPCITLRDETEWIELVESGWNIVAGANQNGITVAAAYFDEQRPQDWQPLYGDGNAAEQIANSLIKR